MDTQPITLSRTNFSFDSFLMLSSSSASWLVKKHSFIPANIENLEAKKSISQSWQKQIPYKPRE